MGRAYTISTVLILLAFATGASGCARPRTAPEVKREIERLRSEDPAERARAAYTLGTMGEKAAPAISLLIPLLADDMEVPRGRYSYVTCGFPTSPAEEAHFGLVRIGKPAVEQLIDALEHEHWRIRYYAAAALGKIGDNRAVEPLIDALGDEHRVVREYAAYALGCIGDGRAVEPLVCALKDRSGAVRCMAAMALRDIGDSRAVEPLIDALRCENLGVRMSVASSLRQMTGEDFGQNHARWREWWEQNRATPAVSAE